MINNTQILITYPGDRSVGIADGEVTIKFTYDVIDGSPVVREKLRKEMTDAFEPFGQSDPSVRFHDECPDCGHVMEEDGEMWSLTCDHATPKYKCTNKNCLSNRPAEE